MLGQQRRKERIRTTSLSLSPGWVLGVLTGGSSDQRREETLENLDFNWILSFFFL
jgi:hypothetical protein